MRVHNIARINIPAPLIPLPIYRRQDYRNYGHHYWRLGATAECTDRNPDEHDERNVKGCLHESPL
jgi:hypothetical protein